MSFWCLQFYPKNERKQVNLRFHSSKVEFVPLFLNLKFLLYIVPFISYFRLMFFVDCYWQTNKISAAKFIFLKIRISQKMRQYFDFLVKWTKLTADILVFWWPSTKNMRWTRHVSHFTLCQFWYFIVWCLATWIQFFTGRGWI